MGWKENFPLNPYTGALTYINRWKDSDDISQSVHRNINNNDYHIPGSNKSSDKYKTDKNDNDKNNNNYNMPTAIRYYANY